MYFTRNEHGDAENGRHETRGFFEFAESCIGIFTTTHEQHGRFLSGRIKIRFSGADGVASAGLNDPDIARALGFRDNVNVDWGEHITHDDDDHFDRRVSIIYKTETLGERTDYEDLRRAARLDIAAIDACLDRAVCAHLRMSPATPAG